MAFLSGFGVVGSAVTADAKRENIHPGVHRGQAREYRIPPAEEAWLAARRQNTLDRATGADVVVMEAVRKRLDGVHLLRARRIALPLSRKDANTGTPRQMTFSI